MENNLPTINNLYTALFASITTLKPVFNISTGTTTSTTNFYILYLLLLNKQTYPHFYNFSSKNLNVQGVFLCYSIFSKKIFIMVFR